MAFMRPLDTRNLIKADFVFFAAGILMLTVITASVFSVVFQSRNGKILLPGRETIVFAQWWEGGMEKNALNGIIADFEKEHPLVNVRLQNANWEEIRAGLHTPDGKVPDVIALDTGRISGIPVFDLLDTLPPLEGDRMGNIAGNADLSQYYYPVVSFMAPLYYNIDILTAAGFLRPPHTREEFLAYAKKTTNAAKGVYGTAFSRNTWTDIFPWLWTGTAGDAIKNINWTDRSVTDALSFLSGLYKDNLVYPQPLAKREDELLDAFLSGRIAMFISSQAAAAEIRAKKPALAFGVTTIPPPAQTGGRNVFPVTEWALAIPVNGEHKEAAVAFLQYLVSRKNDLSRAAHGITGYRYDQVAGEDPIDQKLRALYEASDTAAVSALGLHSETILSEVGNSMRDLFNGRKTEAEIAAELQAVFAQVNIADESFEQQEQ
jgi:ABC-type glycerol-3-phosphate transport system substrate-binding protein